MLSASERALINAIDLAHQKATKLERELKHSLESKGLGHIIRPLAEAMRVEGDSIGQLVLVSRGQEPRVPAIDPDDAREAAREVQWGHQ